MSNLQQNHKDLLQQVLNQIETETGLKYQFTVNEFGNHDTCIIGDFTKRSNIEVYNMDPAYAHMNGVYETYSSIVDKIKELRVQDLFEETKDWTDKKGEIHKIGKCKKCHSYNERITELPTFVTSNCCHNKNCSDRMLFSKWDRLHVSKQDGTLYDCVGGSLSICHTKGYYKFL
jgi:hypothetical protein